MNNKFHWEDLYQTKGPGQVSWYQEHAQLSLQLIQRTQVKKSANIIDVGGGASILVDDLLADGFQNVTVLDISQTALRAAQDRLGVLAAHVTWMEADITRAVLPRQTYEVWHDRAVFHFLTKAEDRLVYVKVLKDSLKIGGYVIMATFALDGPRECSGLDTMQYDARSLSQELGEDFHLVQSLPETHHTPFGTEQKFIYCCFRKEPSTG